MKRQRDKEIKRQGDEEAKRVRDKDTMRYSYSEQCVLFITTYLFLTSGWGSRKRTRQRSVLGKVRNPLVEQDR